MKTVPDIAFRLLRSPQTQSFSSLAGILSIAGMAIGITALLLTFSILNGFEKTISEKISGFDGHIRIEHFMGSSMKESDAVLDSVLSDINANFQVIPYLQKPALIRKGIVTEGVLVDALPSSHIHHMGSLFDYRPEDKSENWVILGDRLAENLGVTIGDKIALMDIEAMGIPGAFSRIGSFTIRGFFHSGLFEYDKTVVYIDLGNAQGLFQMDDSITGRKLILSDHGSISSIIAHLDNTLHYPYYVMTWIEKHQILFQWMATQKLPILIFFGLIALVGIVNIFGAITMIIIEKLRMIGILLTLGMTRKSILKVFMLDGIIIGMAGTSLGIILSLGIIFLQSQWNFLSIPEDIYFMDHVPFHLDWKIVLVHLLLGILISTVASMIPARKAAAIQPSDAIRYE